LVTIQYLTASPTVSAFSTLFHVGPIRPSPLVVVVVVDVPMMSTEKTTQRAVHRIRKERTMVGLWMAAGRGGMSNNNNKSSKVVHPKIGEKMGMASSKTTNIKKSVTKGATTTTTTPFNVNASLMRLEKKYDELTKANVKSLQKDDAEEDNDPDDNMLKTNNDSSNSSSSSSGSSSSIVVTTEYVVAVRADGYIGDWVPIAQLCVARTAAQAAFAGDEGQRMDPFVQAAVAHYCRELCHVASLGSRVFHSVPRNFVQYSIEPLDSFHKHVYETTIQGKNEDATNSNVMTKQDARIVLNLVNGDGDDKAAIKRSYRTLSFEWHPDRFVGIDRSAEDIAAANERYGKIKLAYDTLNSGVRDEGKSWYQSLGGKARTDFVGPVPLIPLDEARDLLERSNVASAITCMSATIVQGFVARSQQ
jgi:DnaJ domain